MTSARLRRTRARMTLSHIAHHDRDRPERYDLDLGVSQATWATLQVVAGPEVVGDV